MWLARHFPGLGLSVSDVLEMTPEMTERLRQVGGKILQGEADERWQHTKVHALAAGMRVR